MSLERRRILFVLPGLAGGGAERATVTLLRHLDRTQLDLHLALASMSGALLEQLPADVPVHDLGARRVRYAPPSLVRLAWKIRPGIVFSRIGHLNLALICAKPFLPSGVKLVVQESSTPSARLTYGVSHGEAWKWLYRRLYRRADLVVCSSQAMLDDLAEYFNVPRRKMIRIYNPVDADQVKRLADVGENPYPTPGPNLVAVGRLSLEKGVDVLLEAFALVREVVTDAKLTVLGDGPLAAALGEQRDRLGLRDSVHFVGFLSNPHPYVKYADLFVMPSRVEGMPNAVLEALALGKPVVATDCVGAMKEIAEVNRRLRLVSSENPAALAEGAVEVLTETKFRDSLDSDSKFEQKFGLRLIMRQYETVFEKVHDGTFL